MKQDARTQGNARTQQQQLASEVARLQAAVQAQEAALIKQRATPSKPPKRLPSLATTPARKRPNTAQHADSFLHEVLSNQPDTHSTANVVPWQALPGAMISSMHARSMAHTQSPLSFPCNPHGPLRIPTAPHLRRMGPQRRRAPRHTPAQPPGALAAATHLVVRTPQLANLPLCAARDLQGTQNMPVRRAHTDACHAHDTYSV